MNRIIEWLAKLSTIQKVVLGIVAGTFIMLTIVVIVITTSTKDEFTVGQDVNSPATYSDTNDEDKKDETEEDPEETGDVEGASVDNEAVDTSNTPSTSNNQVNPSTVLTPELEPVQTVAVGSQVWMKYNLNVGTLINASTFQTNNGIVEKHCYNNDASNCNTYGGLYQWNEMMRYSATESVQGICPSGFHLPSDEEWIKLEMYLGMTRVVAELEGKRGNNEGTKMKPGGSSGLDFPISGYSAAGSFYGIGFKGWLWSSTESSTDLAWQRGPESLVSRDREQKAVGHGVRCLQDGYQ